MGMTDKQFIAFRRKELADFKRILNIAVETKADKAVTDYLKELIDEAQKDIEA
jgi:hypothetical protein